MFDTQLTVIGNVLTEPERRRTTQTEQDVTSFKVVSTARRLDRETKQWVDGNSLRVRVTCWRRLADGVAKSIRLGDPVVVVGRLYTRDWIDDDGNRRVLYEMDAAAVGHDLSRGYAKFARTRPTSSTSAIENEEAEQRIGGEPTAAAPDLTVGLAADDPLHEPADNLMGFGPPAQLHGGGHVDGDLAGGDPADSDPDEDTADAEGELVPAA